MNFLELEKERVYKAHTIASYTRSPKSLKNIHHAISQYVLNNSDYEAQDLTTKEYTFINSNNMGSKKVDIALLKNKELKGAILFKGPCKDYNKNANNYYENMKGESSLFIEDNIPVYQLMWLPDYLPSSSSKKWEVPGQKHLDYYSNFIKNKSSYWDLLKVDIILFHIDYENNYNTTYSNNLFVDGCSKTVEKGLDAFLKEVNSHWTK